MKENILVTICARGGSKGVPGKNIRELAGKPLLLYSLDHARAWPRTTDIYLSTDSTEIADVARRWGHSSPRLRDSHLASDLTGKIEVIKNALSWAEQDKKLKYDIVIDLDITAPLRSIADIEGTYQLLVTRRYDVVISGCEARRNPYFNLVQLDREGRAHLSKRPVTSVLSRQSAPVVYEINCSIYAYRRSFFEKGEIHCIGNNTGLYSMPRERSWDIDHEEDFLITEALMKHQKTL